MNNVKYLPSLTGVRVRHDGHWSAAADSLRRSEFLEITTK